jgi:hypothetical protein
MRREENQLGATEWFIALIICSTCFGQLCAHHQELETILVLLPHMVYNALVAGGLRSGVQDEGSCSTQSSSFPHPGLITAALLLNADNQQPRHYTPHVITSSIV